MLLLHPTLDIRRRRDPPPHHQRGTRRKGSLHYNPGNRTRNPNNDQTPRLLHLTQNTRTLQVANWRPNYPRIKTSRKKQDTVSKHRSIRNHAFTSQHRMERNLHTRRRVPTSSNIHVRRSAHKDREQSISSFPSKNGLQQEHSASSDIRTGNDGWRGHKKPLR